MTLESYIKTYGIRSYRVWYNGMLLYDSNLTEYDCPLLITDSVVVEIKVNPYGMTDIEI